MPAQPPALGQLCTAKMHNEILAVYNIRNPESNTYRGPLYQRNNFYFISFANAIGQGIAAGTPFINFTTIDTGVKGIPLITGTGVGVGIFFDAKFFEQTAYTNVRNAVIANFGKSLHDPYPPRIENVGMYLKAVCKAVGESIEEHYKTAWTLNSTHPIIYTGTGKINNGMFSGIEQDLVISQIMSRSTMMRGRFWPIMVQEIAKAYKLTIETRSYSQVTITGVCIPSTSQVCMISSGGSGTGIAT